MKRVGNSKELTPARMSAVAENLQVHLKCYVCVEVAADSFDHVDEIEVKYSIYISKSADRFPFDSWPKLLKCYRKIMKEGLESVS